MKYERFQLQHMNFEEKTVEPQMLVLDEVERGALWTRAASGMGWALGRSHTLRRVAQKWNLQPGTVVFPVSSCIRSSEVVRHCALGLRVWHHHFGVFSSPEAKKIMCYP